MTNRQLAYSGKDFYCFRIPLLSKINVYKILHNIFNKESFKSVLLDTTLSQHFILSDAIINISQVY